MTIERTIELGEKALKDLETEKESKRIAALTPEQKVEEDAKVQAEAKAKEAKTLLETPDDKLDDAQKAAKAAAVEAEQKSNEAEEKRILEAKEEELTDDDYAQKQKIVEARKVAKEAEREANIQKRIDQIAGELKAERNERSKDKEKIAALEAELKKLGNASGETQDEIEKLEAARVEKYVEADKALPKEKRREMSDEDLTEWMIEDMAGANRWLAKQELRRERERDADAARLNGGSDADRQAEAIIAKQAGSRSRAEAKHPELNVTARVSALQAEGKTEREIQATIFAENPKAKLAAEIIQSNPDKYLLAENGPEMVVEEIEKRMKTSGKAGESQEDRDARIAREAAEAERQRLARIDEGLNSNGNGARETKMGDIEKAQFELFKKSFPGKNLEDFKKMQKRRMERAGA